MRRTWATAKRSNRLVRRNARYGRDAAAAALLARPSNRYGDRLLARGAIGHSSLAGVLDDGDFHKMTARRQNDDRWMAASEREGRMDERHARDAAERHANDALERAAGADAS